MAPDSWPASGVAVRGAAIPPVPAGGCTAVSVTSAPLERADAESMCVQRLHRAGNLSQATALAEVESDQIGPHCGCRSARLAAEQLLCWIHAGDMVRAVEAGTRALADLPGGADEDLAASVRLGLAWAYTARGDRAGREILADLEPRLSRLAETSLGISPYVGILRVWQGHHHEGRVLLVRAQRAAREAGSPSLAFLTAFLADLEYRVGAWGAGECVAAEAEALARRLESPNALGISLVGRARFEAATGRRDAALEHLDEAARVSQRSGAHTLDHMIAVVRGSMALLDGDPDAAVAQLRAAHDRVGVLGIRHPGLAQHHADLVEAFARSGFAAEAGELCDELDRLVSRTGCPPAIAGVARARLLVCADEEVESVARDVRAHFQQVRSPFERARTLLVLGARRRRVGDRMHARVDLAEAQGEFQRLGAQPWSELAGGELRAAGARMEAGEQVATLTGQEMEVARAVGRGLTNREVAASLFLSVKTIERHLTTIYRKLGLRSRAELVLWLGAQEAPPAGD